MGLTEAQHVFGGIHEDGVNDLLAAFFKARPRHLVYGSPGFVAVTTMTEAPMPAIPFPGVPGGIDWSMTLDRPVVDLHPETCSLPPQLTLGPGQFSVRTRVKVRLACASRRPNDGGPQNPDGHSDDGGPPTVVRARCLEVSVFALGHFESTETSSGQDAVRIAINVIELVDLEPEPLEAAIEYLILQTLRAVLAAVRLPLEALRVGALSLTLQRCPEIKAHKLGGQP